MGDLNDNPTDSSIVNVLHAKGNKNEVRANRICMTHGQTFTIAEPAQNLSDTVGTCSTRLLFHHPYYRTKIISSLTAKRRYFKPAFIVDNYKGHEGEPHRSFVGTHWINGYSDHFPVVMYLTK